MPLQTTLPSISRIATRTARVLTALLALSILSSSPASGADDRADKPRPGADKPSLSEQDIQNIPIAEGLRPSAEELARAVGDLKKQDAPAEVRAKAAETIGRQGHNIQYQGRHILIQA